jgi:hypothetical protein
MTLVEHVLLHSLARSQAFAAVEAFAAVIDNAMEMSEQSRGFDEQIGCLDVEVV